jgi:hypothetical protein
MIQVIQYWSLLFVVNVTLYPDLEFELKCRRNFIYIFIIGMEYKGIVSAFMVGMVLQFDGD